MNIGKRGFTLLEVMITLTLFTLAVIAILNAINTGLFGSGDVENIRAALNVAQARMEQIRNTPLASVVNSGPTADTNFPNLSVSVTGIVSGADPKQVNVTVTWHVRGDPVSMTVTTLKTQI